MPNRNIVLTARQAALVERLVESGHYENASAVVREGLRLVEQRAAANEVTLAALRAAAEVDSDAGRFETFESDDALDTYFAGLAERPTTTPGE